jgi:hypothetical protein
MLDLIPYNFKDEVGLRIVAGKGAWARDTYRKATQASIAAGTHYSSNQRGRKRKAATLG